jgi:seryl-tRNA synthetase
MYEETRKQVMIEFQERINKIQNREEELRRYHESLQRRARALDDSEQELKEREAKINKYLLKMKDLEKKISSLQNKRDLRKQELTGLYCMFRNHLERYGVLTEEAANQAFKYLRKAKRKRLF